ncbi:hypothetical protein EOM81_11645, partial [bacterium]|nr:hypothetical protein [bacterium]
MTRNRDFTELKEARKDILQRMIELVKKGYRSTGAGSAFETAIEQLGFAKMSYQAVYIWARKEAPELLKEYQQAVKDNMRSFDGPNVKSVTRPTLIRAIIDEIKTGKRPIGKPNAIVSACKLLGVKVYHWATIHR